MFIPHDIHLEETQGRVSTQRGGFRIQDYILS